MSDIASNASNDTFNSDVLSDDMVDTSSLPDAGNGALRSKMAEILSSRLLDLMHATATTVNNPEHHERLTRATTLEETKTLTADIARENAAAQQPAKQAYQDARIRSDMLEFSGVLYKTAKEVRDVVEQKRQETEKSPEWIRFLESHPSLVGHVLSHTTATGERLLKSVRPLFEIERPVLGRCLTQTGEKWEIVGIQLTYLVNSRLCPAGFWANDAQATDDGSLLQDEVQRSRVDNLLRWVSD